MPMLGSEKGVDIKCRRCGKMAKASDFTVDYVYKMAVCPACVKERRAKEVKSPVAEKNEAFGKPVESAAPKKEMPPGWDADDEKLEKMARQKEKAMQAQTQSAPSQPSMVSKTASLFGFASKSASSASNATIQPKPQNIAPQQPIKQAPINAPQMQTSTPKPVSVMPKEETVKAAPVSSDPSKIRHKCRKCGFEFWYNTERKMPKGCPYCNTGVDAIIFGKMNQ